MKNLLAILPAAALLAVLSSGCGDTCSSSGTEVQPTTGTSCNGLSVTPDATITINARPACQSCAQSSPSCTVDKNATGQGVFVDVTVQECDKDKGCGSASCSFGNVSCTHRIDATWSGQMSITYLSGGTTQTETVTVGGSNPVASCTL